MNSFRPIVVVVVLLALLFAVQAALATSCTLTYANFGQAFLTKYCIKCHASTAVGAARQGSPDGVNFDTPELAAKFAASILNRTVTKADMPPAWINPQPTADERAKVQTWINCEYPR